MKTGRRASPHHHYTLTLCLTEVGSSHGFPFPTSTCSRSWISRGVCIHTYVCVCVCVAVGMAAVGFISLFAQMKMFIICVASLPVPRPEKLQVAQWVGHDYPPCADLGYQLLDTVDWRGAGDGVVAAVSVLCSSFPKWESSRGEIGKVSEEVSV